MFRCLRKKRGYKNTNDLVNWTLMERKILKQVNIVFKGFIRKSYIPCKDLRDAAKERLQYFIDNGTSPTHDGWGLVNKTLDAKGLQPTGEVLAHSYYDEKEMCHAWKYSPKHNEILKGNYSHIGIARQYINNTTYTVCLVGRPKK